MKVYPAPGSDDHEIEIRRLAVGDERAVRAAQAAMEGDDFTFAFDLGDGPDFDFATYVRQRHDFERGIGLTDDWVPNTFLVAVDGDAVVGRVSIRHELNEFLESYGGHIGYCVVPTHRRRGIATRLLDVGLGLLRNLEVDRGLVTCDFDNDGSAAIIEAAGGVLENILDGDDDGIPKRRYWIDLG